MNELIVAANEAYAKIATIPEQYKEGLQGWMQGKDYIAWPRARRRKQ